MPGAANCRGSRPTFRHRRPVAELGLRDAIFARFKAEWHDSVEAVLAITGQEALLEGNPSLARSIRNRFPYIDPLNHIQVELLRRHRAQAPRRRCTGAGERSGQ
jgi:phosphoenolpyruvate carboxylase